MNTSNEKTVQVFAPAKINLFLHILGRRSNGYHELESLVSFADIGDYIQIKPHSDFAFSVTGEYAAGFNAKEIDASPGSSNLVVKAIWALARHYKKAPNFKIILEKNIPLASGIGGGSTDAAAAIWGALEYWGILKNAANLNKLMCDLGADIPVCFAAKASYMRGIGEHIMPLEYIPDIPVVLVNPLIPCPTQDVFVRYNHSYSDKIATPQSFENAGELIDFLSRQDNDLMEAACENVPEIQNILNLLSSFSSCHLSRLSGSGATCFGLFEDVASALDVCESIKSENPDWWVKCGHLNRADRY